MGLPPFKPPPRSSPDVSSGSPPASAGAAAKAEEGVVEPGALPIQRHAGRRELIRSLTLRAMRRFGRCGYGARPCANRHPRELGELTQRHDGLAESRRRLHSHCGRGDDGQAQPVQQLPLEGVVGRTNSKEYPSDEPIHQRHVQRITIRHLHLEQIGILNIDTTAGADCGTARSQAIVGNLANPVHLDAKVVESLASRIQDTNARIGLQRLPTPFHGAHERIERRLGRMQRGQPLREPPPQSFGIGVTHGTQASCLQGGMIQRRLGLIHQCELHYTEDDGQDNGQRDDSLDDGCAALSGKSDAQCHPWRSGAIHASLDLARGDTLSRAAPHAWRRISSARPSKPERALSRWQCARIRARSQPVCLAYPLGRFFQLFEPDPG